MKKIVITIFSALLLNLSSTEAQLFKKKTTNFTSTQLYQIMCWQVKRVEKLTLNAYKCQAQKKTVGWGFNTEATGIKSVKSKAHADELFKNLITKKYNEVNKAFPALSYMQKSVIVSLYYNTGSLSAIKKSDFLKHLVAGNTKKAISYFKKWNKVQVKDKRGNVKYVVSKGLINRREFESKLLAGTFDMKDYESLKKDAQQAYQYEK